MTRLFDFILGWLFKLFNRGFNAGTNTYIGIEQRMMRLSLIVLLVYGGLLY